MRRENPNPNLKNRTLTLTLTCRFSTMLQALLAGEPLPPENRDYKLSWLKAEQEAVKSEYAFKLGLNYYNN